MNDSVMIESEADDGDAQVFVVPPDIVQERLDKVLVTLCPELSRTRIKNLIDDGEVTVDGRACTTPAFKVSTGQMIEMIIPPPIDAAPQAEDIPLDVVYEDDDLLVINKPAGLVVHPGAGNWTGTLVNALLHYCGDELSGIGGVVRPGIVHRLDRDTTGLMVVAKTDLAHRGLSAQLADRSLSRTYTALVWDVTQPKGLVDRPILRSSSNRQKMTIALGGGGRDARTHYRRIKTFGDVISLIECDLETGRTHQIRVHMESIKHPLIGDPAYGMQRTGQTSRIKKADFSPELRDALLNFPRQALHASHIRFIHPGTDEEMEFDIDPPEDMGKLIEILGR